MKHDTVSRSPMYYCRVFPSKFIALYFILLVLSG
jgi:hypothetical protein